jgi:AcrR family transcriptional regulator
MANRKNNVRFRQTETRMEAAALVLMRDARSKRLTVSAVCAAAEVNRSTFYAHFLDIPDMLRKMEDHLHHELLERYHTQGVRPLSAESFVPFLDHIADHAYFYRLTLPLHSTFPLEQGYEQMMGMIVRPLSEAAGITDEGTMVYLLVFFQAGFTMVLRRWVDGGCVDDRQKVAQTLADCVPAVWREGADGYGLCSDLSK